MDESLENMKQAYEQVCLEKEELQKEIIMLRDNYAVKGEAAYDAINDIIKNYGY